MTNGAYYFDGSSAYITTPLTSVLFSNDFTASVWFNVVSVASGWQCLLSEQNLGFILQIAGANCGCSEPERLISYSASPPGPGGIQNWLLYPPQQTPTNTFEQVVITKQGLSVRMYVNGKVAATNQVQNQTVALGNYMTIGRAYSMNPGEAFGGVIDDVRIYSRALSASEVQELYAYESGPSVTLLKAVKPSFSNLYLGRKYKLQASDDLSTWYDQGPPFTATSTEMDYPEYYDVDFWNQLYFRLQVSP